MRFVCAASLRPWLLASLSMWASACALTFDSTVTVVADTGASDAAGDTAMDTDSDRDTQLPDTAVDAEDAANDAPSEDTDVQGGGTPDVTVTEPTATALRIGETVTIGWEVEPSTLTVRETTVLLVDDAPCEAGDDTTDAVEIAVVTGSERSVVWEIPLSVPQDTYRIRVEVMTTGGEPGFACSRAFAATEPAVCEPFSCEDRNRVCDATGDDPVCGDCLPGFERAGGDCAPVDCGSAPAAPDNAVLQTVTSSVFGGEVQYGCLPGYSTTGAVDAPTQVIRTCGPDGNWSEPNGVCRPLDCGAVPAATLNARLTTFDRTTVGGVASYACDEGFAVVSAGSPGYVTECEPTGMWSAAAQCVRVECGSLTAPDFGSVSTASGSGALALAEYDCDAGYELNGVASRTCQLTSQWSDVAPTCTPVDCGTAPVVANGTFSGSGQTLGASLTYSCNTGFTLAGSPTVSCAATGNWTTAPVCNDNNECETRTEYCTGFGNNCRNIPGSWECVCNSDSQGSTVTGGNASCEAYLGSPCTADANCPENFWCSTVAGLQRCAPVALSATDAEMRFVYVPSGTFTQGAVSSDTDAGSNENRWSSTITRSYFVSQTEVTQAQWTSAPGASNPSQFSAGRMGTCDSVLPGDCPVEGMRWIGAIGYANWLSEDEGLEPCYVLSPPGCSNLISDWSSGGSACLDVTFVGLDCEGYRLLTESEWERAARSNVSLASIYLWGDGAGIALGLLQAWSSENASNRTHGVGELMPNPWGIYDMAGNVDEWVWDRFSNNYPSGSATDYLGADVGPERSLRGGSYPFPQQSMRISRRSSGGPLVASSSLGFRLARTVPDGR